mgnify:CR=1 FL=1|jgi:hypothetical protein|tara:strand:- start:13 stop:729 length:717 start_codon:yes stop_codon:yes gene_type:complete
MSTQKKTLLLAQPNHFLADANNMDIDALSSVTREEISNYKTAYEGDYEVSRQTDLAVSQEATNAIKENLDLLFGTNSKQARYFDRELKGGETLFDIHYRGIKSPSELTRKVERAEREQSVTSTVSIGGVDNVTMKEVSTGIEYLIKNGYAYGVDFSATNATDVAKSVYLENVFQDTSKARYEIADSIDRNQCTDRCLEGITLEDYSNGSFDDESGSSRTLTIELKDGHAVSVIGGYND